ncbi:MULTISPECIES: helix-turn-helix domain-containing protein [Photorhabdus]|uniref:helix-turn-helix domain-containing protein n=1 Tax=Photorhabdus TaxID=29487 RepID=UPI001EF0912C|nr:MULTISPECIES: hypothetical protein [Photorhabdus]
MTEERKVYHANIDIHIREVCLIPFERGWQAPSAGEFRAMLSKAGVSQSAFARRIGVSSRTVRRWVDGSKPVNYAAWCILCVDGGYLHIWRATEETSYPVADKSDNLAVTQGITIPDPLRLQYRNVIKQIVYRVVATPEMDSIDVIDKLISDELSQSERHTLKALIIEELRRLHEGVLARYGLRPSQLEKWKRKHR